MLVPHMAVTVRRIPFLMEREYRTAFYRVASSLQFQPHVRGIIGESWWHSDETHRVTPHLAFLNAPYLEAGAVKLDIGPAGPEDGFLEGSPERAALYASGEYKPTIGVLVCSRAQALAWVQANAHLEAATRVR